METLTFEVGERPNVLIRSVGRDLRLVGQEGTSLEAQASTRDDLTWAHEGERFVLSCRGGCLIFLPPAAQVEVERVGGDSRVTALSGALKVGTVGGDLSLRRVAQTMIGRVGGDLHVYKAAGELSVEAVGGDAVIEHAEQGVQLAALGGDLVLRRVEGEVRASTGGEARVDLSPRAGTCSSVSAGGDMLCLLPADASAVVRLHAGGDVSLGLPAGVERSPNGDEVRLGSGEGALDLAAGGDLRLQVGGDAGFGREMGDDIAARVEAQVDAAIAEMEAHLDFGGISKFRGDRIAERIRRSMDKAHRRTTRAAHRAQAAGPSRSGPRPSFSDMSTTEPVVSDEERLSILRMLEEGKITVEQAEKLFEALEGKA